MRHGDHPAPRWEELRRMTRHDPATCTVEDCPICERLAEDRADPPLDNRYENDWASDRALDRYERWLWHD